MKKWRKLPPFNGPVGRNLDNLRKLVVGLTSRGVRVQFVKREADANVRLAFGRAQVLDGLSGDGALQ
jgi:hypothetical protein